MVFIPNNLFNTAEKNKFQINPHLEFKKYQIIITSSEKILYDPHRENFGQSCPHKFVTVTLKINRHFRHT